MIEVGRYQAQHRQHAAHVGIDSIKEAAATVAYGLVKFYTGNNTGDVPGNLPAPHYCTSRPICSVAPLY